MSSDRSCTSNSQERHQYPLGEQLSDIVASSIGIAAPVLCIKRYSSYYHVNRTVSKPGNTDTIKYIKTTAKDLNIVVEPYFLTIASRNL